MARSRPTAVRLEHRLKLLCGKLVSDGSWARASPLLRVVTDGLADRVRSRQGEGRGPVRARGSQRPSGRQWAMCRQADTPTEPRANGCRRGVREEGRKGKEEASRDGLERGAWRERLVGGGGYRAGPREGGFEGGGGGQRHCRAVCRIQGGERPCRGAFGPMRRETRDAARPDTRVAFVRVGPPA